VSSEDITRYSEEFKVRVRIHARRGISPIETVARLKRVPKQTSDQRMKLEFRFGKTGLENRKPEAKPEQINVTFENFVIQGKLIRIAAQHDKFH